MELDAYQFLEDAAVEGLLGLAALEKVVVVVLEAVPVFLELLQAVGVDVLDTVNSQYTDSVCLS